MPKQSSVPESKILAAMAGVDAGLSHREASKRYGVPLGTLKARLRRYQVERPRVDESDASDADASGWVDASTPDATPRRRPSPALPRDILLDERLDARRSQAALLIVQGQMTLIEVAQEVGVATSTLREWRKDVVFSAVCSDLRREMHQRAREAVSRGAEEAVDGLRLSLSLMRSVVVEGLEVIEEEDEPVLSAAEVKRRAAVVSQALKAATSIPGIARPLMDAGGFPKTERVEVTGATVTLKDRSFDELEEEEAELESQLRLLEGGAA